MNSEKTPPPLTKILYASLRRPLLPAGVLIVLVVISCSTLDRTVLLPPAVPGAEFVGTDACAECHEDLTRSFPTATHARLIAPGTNAVQAGCEACHGPGSLHVQSGGDVHAIVNPGRFPEVCYQCHLNIRAQFALPYHHPVPEGKITCVDCHESHHGPALPAGGTALFAERDLCAQCHRAQMGPFVFEHEAMREGCTSCHNVHGSVNNKLLQERNANLCLKCHFQRQTARGEIVIGGRDHTSFLSRGTCWSAGCHEAIHGSQVTSSLRF